MRMMIKNTAFKTISFTILPDLIGTDILDYSP